MLSKRIIPCLDINGGRVVKGVNFINLVDAGDPVEVADAYDKIGADEIVFLDITASSDGRKTAVDILSRERKGVHPAHRGRRDPHGGRFPRHAFRRSG